MTCVRGVAAYEYSLFFLCVAYCRTIKPACACWLFLVEVVQKLIDAQFFNFNSARGQAGLVSKILIAFRGRFFDGLDGSAHGGGGLVMSLAG